MKSTVPVGTNDKVREIVATLANHRIDVCSVPEFLKEGSAIEDFMRPDRVVIGSAQRAGDRDPARAARAFRAHRQSDPRDGSALGRADQVCVQRDARDAHFVHQRDRESVRGGRRGDQSTCGAASGTDRRIGSSVPVSRGRLRRLMLSQGCAGADPYAPARTDSTSACCRRLRTLTRIRSAFWSSA